MRKRTKIRMLLVVPLVVAVCGSGVVVLLLINKKHDFRVMSYHTEIEGNFTVFPVEQAEEVRRFLSRVRLPDLGDTNILALHYSLNDFGESIHILCVFRREEVPALLKFYDPTWVSVYDLAGEDAGFAYLRRKAPIERQDLNSLLNTPSFFPDDLPWFFPCRIDEETLFSESRKDVSEKDGYGDYFRFRAVANNLDYSDLVILYLYLTNER